MSYTRLLRVPYMYAIVLAALNLAIVGYVQPKARYAYEGLRFELRSGALGASIKVGEFTKLGERMTLRIEESYNDGRSLRGIFVRGEQRDGQRVSATAARAAKPWRRSRIRRSRASAASPPNRCAQPVISRNNPSGGSSPTSGV